MLSQAESELVHCHDAAYINPTSIFRLFPVNSVFQAFQNIQIKHLFETVNFVSVVTMMKTARVWMTF